MQMCLRQRLTVSKKGGDQISLDGDGYAEFDAVSDAAPAQPCQWLRTKTVKTRKVTTDIPQAVREHRDAVLRVKYLWLCLDTL